MNLPTMEDRQAVWRKLTFACRPRCPRCLRCVPSEMMRGSMDMRCASPECGATFCGFCFRFQGSPARVLHHAARCTMNPMSLADLWPGEPRITSSVVEGMHRDLFLNQRRTEAVLLETDPTRRRMLVATPVERLRHIMTQSRGEGERPVVTGRREERWEVVS